LLEGLAEQAWSRRATVVGAGKPLELTVLAYPDRWARHESVHWKQIAKTVSAFAV
jgi:hypothetical protein